MVDAVAAAVVAFAFASVVVAVAIAGSADWLLFRARGYASINNKGLLVNAVASFKYGNIFRQDVQDLAMFGIFVIV